MSKVLSILKLLFSGKFSQFFTQLLGVLKEFFSYKSNSEKNKRLEMEKKERQEFEKKVHDVAQNGTIGDLINIRK